MSGSPPSGDALTPYRPAAAGGGGARGEGPSRICVYGPSGSGKTTLAAELGRRLGLPHVELDAIYHSRPNWKDLSREEFRTAVTSRLAETEGGWVFDGNYWMVRDLVLPRADTVVWLRLAWRTVYPRLLRRSLSRMVSREVLWGVNRESFRLTFLSRESILWWGIHHWRPGIRSTEQALATIPHSATVHVLRSPRAVREFLASVAPVDGCLPRDQ